MDGEAARQRAEDHYYAALDLMADGQTESAVAELRNSLSADPTFTEAMHGLTRALEDLATMRLSTWPSDCRKSIRMMS